LRLKDVDGLEAEDVHFESACKARENLRENGATNEEIDFLIHKRVELNAFASDEFIAWIEGKLREHGITKVVPDRDIIASAYKRMRRQALVQERINEALVKGGEEAAEPPPPPDDIIDRITKRLTYDPALCWDAALREIAEDDHEEAGRESGAEP
jgi:hypothetical protein